MSLGVMVLLLFALFGGILVLLNAVMVLVALTLLVLAPLWIALAALLNHPGRYQ